MKRTVGVVLSAIVAGAAGLAAEAGVGVASSPAGARAASLNACKLLKRSEVAKVIGEPVARVSGGGTATGAKYCHWYGNDSHILQKGISIIAANDFAKQRYKLYKRDLHAKTPVKGVGDAAATDGQVLITRIGNGRFLDISPLYNNTGITVDMLKPLARKGLSRIH